MNAGKKAIAVLGAGLSALYLLNLTFGVGEVIPDNLPFAGNIDEVVATLVLMKCLTTLGIDTSRLLGRRPNSEKSP